MDDLYIRWMIRRDMPSVLATENCSFPEPWTEEEFIRCLRCRNCIGMVAEVGGAVVGYVIYELHQNRLHILNLAVDPWMRHQGIGRAMVEKLIGKLHPDRRSRILLEVRETNLAAQLFFRACGFRAISVLRDFYSASDEDAFLFQYRLRSKVEAQS